MDELMLHTIFIAYSRKDHQYLEELREHFAPLEKSSNVEIWFDGKIDPGVVWEEKIKKKIQQADIILLLVSASSIASEYFFDIEVQDAIRRHELGHAIVIPFILRPCAWKATKLSKLQALPKNGLPVSSWKNKDDAYTYGVNQILDLIQKREELHSRASGESVKTSVEVLGENQKGTDDIKGRLRKKRSNENISWYKNTKVENPIILTTALIVIIASIFFVVNIEKERKKNEPLSIMVNADTISVDSSLLRAYTIEIDKAQSLISKEEYGEAKKKFEDAKAFAKSNNLEFIDAEAGILLCIKEINIEKEGKKNEPLSIMVNADTTSVDSSLLRAYTIEIDKAQSLISKEEYREAKKKFEDAKAFAKSNNLDFNDAEAGILLCIRKLNIEKEEKQRITEKMQYKKWKDKGDIEFSNGNFLEAKKHYEKASEYNNDQAILKLISDCSYQLERSKSIDNIEIPNSFSPNNDGKNDFFFIDSDLEFKILQFKIWNRWGELVYDNDNETKGWDGTKDGEKSPSDVYFYQVIIEANLKTKTMKGDVTLIR